MKKYKNGVSLIVLVVTIIVVIILAAAVILTMDTDNPIFSAKTAVEKEDYIEAQNAYNMWLSQVMVAQLDEVSFSGWFGIKMNGNNKRISKESIYYQYTEVPSISNIKEKAAPGTFTLRTKDENGNKISASSGYTTDTGANLKKEVYNNFVKKAGDTVTLGLPKQVHSIFILDNQVIGMYKNDAISFINPETDEITVVSNIKFKG